MGGQCVNGFLEEGCGNFTLADHDHRFESVAKPSEISFLFT
jgi:hypothetical protein